MMRDAGYKIRDAESAWPRIPAPDVSHPTWFIEDPVNQKNAFVSAHVRRMCIKTLLMQNLGMFIISKWFINTFRFVLKICRPQRCCPLGGFAEENHQAFAAHMLSGLLRLKAPFERRAYQVSRNP
jgi:hypothetical protein